MNRYAQFSKAIHDKDDELLSWKLHLNKSTRLFDLVFSDGTKKHFPSRKDAIRYINDKFFSMYF